MSLCLLLGQVNASALKNIVNTEFAPGNESCIAVALVGKNLNGLAVNGNSAVLIIADDFAIETAVNGVILYTVSDVGSGMTGSVDCNDFDVVRLDGCAESQRTDAAETIDTDFNH